ncbi:MAG: thioredoxin [Chlorobi bacterium]|nr:thioredoxin [Chlorobiota bacterium]
MNSGRFKNAINSEKIVLVDFYTDWCAPCKLMGPVLEEVKNDLKDNIKIIKVNVDSNPFIAATYKIQSIPTLVIFINGNIYWKGIGLKTAQEIKSALKKQE